MHTPSFHICEPDNGAWGRVIVPRVRKLQQKFMYTRSLAGGCQNEMNRKLKREGLVVDGWDETNEQKRDRAAEKELHET